MDYCGERTMTRTASVIASPTAAPEPPERRARMLVKWGNHNPLFVMRLDSPGHNSDIRFFICAA